jgi:hypothetical protein
MTLPRRDLLKTIALSPGAAALPGGADDIPWPAGPLYAPVTVSMYSVYVPACLVEDRLPGGLSETTRGRRAAVRGGLVVWTSMSMPDALTTLRLLETKGLQVRPCPAGRDAALAESSRGLITACDWLETLRRPDKPFVVQVRLRLTPALWSLTQRLAREGRLDPAAGVNEEAGSL